MDTDKQPPEASLVKVDTRSAEGEAGQRKRETAVGLGNLCSSVFICGRAWLWALSLFLVGLGAKLWLILRFGTPLPFWDQWEEARVVYLPYFEGKLSLAGLFSAHNEHRIFFTRIYGLGLLL